MQRPGNGDRRLPKQGGPRLPCFQPWPVVPGRSALAPCPTGEPERGLGLQLSLQVPAQTPSSTREKMISSKALATLLTPIRTAGTMAKTLLISRVPFLQGQQSPEGRALRRQKLSPPAPALRQRSQPPGNVPARAGGWKAGADAHESQEGRPGAGVLTVGAD